MGIFDRYTVYETGKVREIFSHGTRRMEILNGETACLWQCIDEGDASGAVISRLVAKLYIPLRCYMWNKTATGLWLYERGLNQVPPEMPQVAISPTTSERPRMLM